jgi:phosphatidylserine decarboxylase
MVLARPHPAARPFLIGGAAVALLGGALFGGFLFWLGVAFTLFCLYFFRDPERIPPARPGLVLAPASCELLKNLMLGEAPIVDPAPYAPAGRLGLV